jgi:hypothetical protein
MSDSLLRDLSRSPDHDLRRVGDALGSLTPSGVRPASGPRASEALAEFLAVPQTSSAAQPEVTGSAPAPDLVIHLGPPAATNRRTARLGWPALLGRGLFAKAVLGGTLVLAAGAGLAAVAGPLGHDTVVVTPAAPTATPTPTAPTRLLTDGHEGRAHAGDSDDGVRPPQHRATKGTTAPAQPAATEDPVTGTETGSGRSESGSGESSARTDRGDEGQASDEARDDEGQASDEGRDGDESRDGGEDQAGDEGDD